MYMKINKFTPPNRYIGLPTTIDNVAPALTATYENISVMNMLNTKHYPRMGVGVVYETE